jgi:hypothetical protein
LKENLLLLPLLQPFMVSWLAAVQSGLCAAATSPCNMFSTVLGDSHLHVTAVALAEAQHQTIQHIILFIRFIVK